MAKVDCKVENCQFCNDEGSCTNPTRLDFAQEDCICEECGDCDCFISL